jgi:hypothetical protein
MLERKREVVAEHSTYYVCDVHGWDFTGVDEDVCPVCFGESLERERIINLLENPKCKPNDHDYINGCNCDVIAIIKGENK